MAFHIGPHVHETAVAGAPFRCLTSDTPMYLRDCPSQSWHLVMLSLLAGCGGRSAVDLEDGEPLPTMLQRATNINLGGALGASRTPGDPAAANANGGSPALGSTSARSGVPVLGSTSASGGWVSNGRTKATGGTKATGASKAMGGVSAYGGTKAAGGALSFSGTETGANTTQTGGNSSGGEAALPICGSDGQRLIVLGRDQNLYRLIVPTLEIQLVGEVDCGTILNSMAISRAGEAYVSSSRGELFRVDTKTAKCFPTPFDGSQVNYRGYGMGFGSGIEPGSEALYMVFAPDGPSSSIGIVDIEDYTLKATVTLTPDFGNAEVLGDQHGNLYLYAYQDSRPGLFGVDPKTGNWWEETRFWENFAFSSYDFALVRDTFYFFAGSGSPFEHSTVARCTASEFPSEVGELSVSVIGAGSETCTDAHAQ